MADEIIVLEGKYEVHPSAEDETHCVVNGETGQVRNGGLSLNDAIELAAELNK